MSEKTDNQLLREAAAAARIEYPEALPVSRHAAEIRELWKHHQLLIVAGATGSGKTTQLPKIALELGCGRAGRVGVTQPRRIAAYAMARRLAEELASPFGTAVGCQVRFDDRTADCTFLKFMTDGILLAETRHDRLLRQYDCLIVDEAHERSLNIDFLLGYLKTLLPKRPDLRVAVSSATLDVEQFSKFFDNAPVVTVEGRAFPVEDHYLPPEPEEELSEHVGRAVEFLSELDSRGDILVFLPGEREIRDAADLLRGRNLRNLEILPLYARLAADEQQKVFHPGRVRRVVLATNVAETSLTIPGIKYCVDSGLARVSRYNPRTRIQELQIEMISQAAARQRRGRCGRTADGVCVRLYGEDDYANAPAFTDPEIKRTGLAGVILQMAALQLPKIEHFPFIDPPQSVSIREGVRTLLDIEAISPGGRVGTVGWKLAALPVDPQLGKMLLSAVERRVLPEMLVIAAYLSVNDPRERPAEKAQAADQAHRRFADEQSDFLGILKLWNGVSDPALSNSSRRRFCRDNFLNANRVREWRNLVADLAGNFPKTSMPGVLDNFSADAIHESILSGIPRNLACYDAENRNYVAAGNRKFYLFPGSGLFKRRKPAEWLVAFALVETSRVFARQVAEVTPALFERAAPHLLGSVCDQAHYEPSSGFVRARERVLFAGLVIHPGRRIDYARRDPVAAREIFIREGLLPGVVEAPGTWVSAFRRRREELLALELKLRRPDSVYDAEGAARYFLENLPAEINSVPSLKKAAGDWCPPAEAMMQEQYGSFDPGDYPDSLCFDGAEYPLEYRFEPGEPEDGAMLVVSAEELNLLPGWALDYPPAGYLPELVSRLFKGLPRDLRREFNNAGATAEFLRRRRTGELLAEQPLFHALSDFLHDEYGLTVSARAFDEIEYPEYLKLKLAVLNEQGKITEVRRDLPDRASLGSRVAGGIPGVREMTASGCSAWPPGPALPESTPLPGGSGKIAYPALVDETDTVGRQLFLSSGEAHTRHRAGVLRLFRLENAQQIKFIRRSLRWTNEMRLSWLMADREKRYDEDLTDSVVELALGGELWNIRSGSAYRIAADRGRQNLGEAADARQCALEQLYELYRTVMEAVHKLHTRAPAAETALRSHLDLLFAPGFLKRPAVWSDYPRYLKALRIRAGRMLDNPARDAAKASPLEPYFDRFALALESVGELTASPELYEFWRLLEECRIAVFAPEVPQTTRAPVTRLPDAWENLRY